MSNRLSWLEAKLNTEEAVLLKNGVPKRQWGYILANSAPHMNNHDKLGAIYTSRAELVQRISDVPDNLMMGVKVVDGLDLETIRRWIGGRDWTQQEEAKWVALMLPAANFSK